MRPATFSFVQISCLFLFSIGLMNHVLLIPVLMDIAGRDAWLSVLLAGVTFIPVSWLIASLIRRTEQKPLLGWIAERYGGWMAHTIAVYASVFMLISFMVTCKDVKIWTTASYLPATPSVIIVASLILIAGYAVWKGFRTVSYCASMLLPFVVLFGEFVMFANFQHKEYDMLLPVFEYGQARMWKGFLCADTGFAEMTLLLFLQHHLSTAVKRRHVIILGLLLLGLSVGPVTGSIAEFGPVEAAMQRYPPFEEWRLVQIGSYISHVDFLSIFQWVTGAFVRMSFLLLIVSESFPLVYRKRIVFALCVAMFMIIQYPLGDMKFFAFLRDFYFPATFYGMLLLLLWITLLVAIGKRPIRREAA
ncbi:MAG: endospore germination permease [Paenibacillaceae bacterium]|nr:endospore germination permease [Paenibacillaceae bacterium]